MPYIGQRPSKGDENNFKILDDISSYTLTFDGSSASVVSAANDTITSLTHRFVQGQRVTYTDGDGSAIAGLTDGTVYYIIKEDHNTIKLATSASNAANGTAVNITNVGGGSSHTLNVAFDGVNTKFKATHTNGQKARITRSAQLVISMNGVIQQPHDTATPSTGFGFDLDGTIIFSQAPVSSDIFWAHVLTNNNVTFDISDNDVDNFTGNGSTVSFNLSKTPPDNRNVLVTIDGVVQYPNDPDGTVRAYTVVENVLTFTTAPDANVEIQVRHIGFAGSTSGSGGVTSFYGRTGAVVLKNTDNIVANNAEFAGNLTVQGTMTTLDTKVTEVDELEVAANNTTVGVAITQSGSGDILNLYDGSTEVFSVADGGTSTFTVGTNKSVQIYAATHNDESELGAGIGFSRQSDGATPLSGIFGHSNSGLGIAARDHITFLTGGTSLVNDTEERVRIDSNGIFKLGTSLTANHVNNVPSDIKFFLNSGRGNYGGLSASAVLFDNQTAAVDAGGTLTLAGFTGSNAIAKASIRGGNEGSSSTNNGYFAVFTRPTSGSLAERLRIASDGKIGIGTNNPVTLLEVQGSTPVLRVTGASATPARLDLTSTGVVKWSLLSNDVSSALSIEKDDSVKFVIDTLGRVGIGTNNPTEELHITAATPVIRLEDSDTNRQSQIVGENGNLRFDADNNNAQANSNIRFRIDSSEKLRITSGGYVGINETSPIHALSIGINTTTAWAANKNISNTTNNDFIALNVDNHNSGSNPEVGIMLQAGASGSGQYTINCRKSGGNAADLIFRTRDGGAASKETLRLNSGGDLILGGHTGVIEAGGYESHLEVHGTATDAGISIYRYSANSGGPTLVFGKSRNGTIGSYTTVHENDNLGKIQFYGTDTDWEPAAAIQAYADGEWRSGSAGSEDNTDSPGRLEFHTTPNGSDDLQERLRITSSGDVGIGLTNPEYKVTVYDADYTGVTIKSNRNTATDNIGGLHFKTRTTNVAYIQSLVDGTIKFRNSSSLTERLRLKSDGKLFLHGTGADGSNNTTTRLPNGYTFNIHGNSSEDGISIVRYNSGYGAYGLNIGRSRSNTVGTNLAVVDGNELGHITFYGANGSSFSYAAQITAIVDGEVGTGGDTTDMPGALSFRTTADGSGGSTPTERLRIQSTGKVGINASEPDTYLHVKGDGGYATNKAGMKSNGVLKLQPHASDSTNMLFSSVNSGNGIGVQVTNGPATANWDIALNPFGGKVGIGTDNPSQTLTVYGTDSSSFRISKAGILAYDHTFDGSTYEIKNNNGSAGIPLIIGTILGGAESLRIEASGNIRIPYSNNNTGLRQKIQFVTEANYFDEVGYIAMDRTAVSSAPSDMILAAGSVGSVDERIRIKADGNVGINQDKPQARLHVKGDSVPDAGANEGSQTGATLCLEGGARSTISGSNYLDTAILHIKGQITDADANSNGTHISGRIVFSGRRATGAKSYIESRTEWTYNTQTAASSLIFLTTPTSSNGGDTPLERMSIDTNGNVDIRNTLTMGSGYGAASKESSDSNSRTYVHWKGNAIGGNQGLNGDNRSPKPHDFKRGRGMSCFFSSISGNNSGHYTDAMHFSTYSDWSGGSPNLFMINKSSNQVRVIRGAWDSSHDMDDQTYNNYTIYDLDFTVGSDLRLKEDINTIENNTALSLVTQLRPVTYKWKDEYINSGYSRNEKENEFTEEEPLTEGGPKRQVRKTLSSADKVVNVGLIAQEVESVIPTVVHEGHVGLNAEDGTNYKNIDYDKIVPYLIGAIKELKSENDALKKRLDDAGL